jgi:peptidoglycan/xylan/chitin deacetylase (PgdA/CDA1 family)
MSGARLAILIYHRVLPATDPFFPEETTARVFEGHMSVLRRFFRVLPLEEAVERLAEGTLPARAACVTFDDGYRDNYTTALPILARQKLPATFFIASGYIAEPGVMWNDILIEALRTARSSRIDLGAFDLGAHVLDSWDSRRAAFRSLVRQIKYRPAAEREEVVRSIAKQCGATVPRCLMMSRDEVAQMHAAGMSIGAHTMTHPILRQVTPAEARREIADGRAFLEGVIGRKVTLFAYPNGRPGEDYDDSHVDLVRDAGFAAAVSTRAAMASRDSDFFQLPRFSAWDRAAPVFLARMLARFTLPRKEVA